MIDQAAVVAPPKLAPVNVKAVGLADWQTEFGPPAETVGPVTVMVICDVYGE